MIDWAFQLACHRWVSDGFGHVIADDMRERCLRLLEETCELAQATGLSRADVTAVADYVFAGRCGDPAEETVQVQLCLAVLATAARIDIAAGAASELDRISHPDLQSAIVKKWTTKPCSIRASRADIETCHPGWPRQTRTLDAVAQRNRGRDPFFSAKWFWPVKDDDDGRWADAGEALLEAGGSYLVPVCIENSREEQRWAVVFPIDEDGNEETEWFETEAAAAAFVESYKADAARQDRAGAAQEADDPVRHPIDPLSCRIGRGGPRVKFQPMAGGDFDMAIHIGAPGHPVKHCIEGLTPADLVPLEKSLLSLRQQLQPLDADTNRQIEQDRECRFGPTARFSFGYNPIQGPSLRYQSGDIDITLYQFGPDDLDRLERTIAAARRFYRWTRAVPA